MAKPLRLLLVEDSEEDADLLLRQLVRGGYEPQHRRVDTREEMAAALLEQDWDTIIADYSLPAFSAPDALALVKELGIDVPFLIVSGTVGEDAAVAAMKAGAHDYLTKTNLARLTAAVERELREAAGRRAHREAEQSLREREAYLTAILASVPDGIVTIDERGLVESANPAAERIFGYGEGEMVDQVFGELVARAPAGGRDPTSTITSVGTREALGRRRDGATFPMDLAISRMQAGERQLLIAIVRDVTEQKRLEEQLRHAQKTESIGRLAGGIAHDFNNLLAVILSYTNLALRDPTDARVRGDLEEIQHAAQRAAGLTRQLLTFSRRQVIEPKLLNLNELILDMDKMLRRLIGEDIELVVLPSPEIEAIRADRGQIEQVLMNLVLNARDAMPDGGKVIIETANADIDPEYAGQYPGVKPGPFVMLAVTDTGIGMSDEVKSHLFEPFFTSKEPGKGTGLGLATSYGIVRQSGGLIWVYSEPGAGSTFKVYLPSVGPAPASKPVSPESGPARASGLETVLVVEDEPALRDVAVRGLRDHGYVVLQASDGAEALRVAERYGKRIDLLLTDVVMPGMGGRKVAERLRAARPDLRVVFTSGYTDSAFLGGGRAEPGTAFLQKPFTIATLARKVRETLDAQA